MMERAPMWTVTKVIDFEGLVEHGKASGAVCHDGMPWSFEYMGQPVTHENDACYLVGLGPEQVRFERGDILLIGEDGTARVLKSPRVEWLEVDGAMTDVPVSISELKPRPGLDPAHPPSFPGIATQEQKASVCLSLRQFAELFLRGERFVVDADAEALPQEHQEGIAELLADAAFLIDGQTFKEASEAVARQREDTTP